MMIITIKDGSMVMLVQIENIREINRMHIVTLTNIQSRSHHDSRVQVKCGKAKAYDAQYNRDTK